MGIQDEESFLQRELSLRKILVNKPKNSKVMSQLAALLAERCKEIKDNNERSRLRLEAIELANRAVEIAPQKPFGHAALSSIHESMNERMAALKKAIEYSKEKYPIARIGFLIRQLIEPREEEARSVRGKIGKASQNHPNKRKLNEYEEACYKEIELVLDGISSMANLSQEEKEFVSKQEYQLGLFFRKKEPAATQRPRARKHLTNSLQDCSLNSEMARFWLATLGKGSNTTNDTLMVEKCPADYIVGLYSTFAERFDELLVEKLGYQTPIKLRSLFNKSVKGTTKLNTGMDLGCGTGLSGQSFCDIVNELHGVDLSPEMIEKAKARNCYSSLQVKDVVCAFSNDGDQVYDIVLSCDVFCYIGDLSEVFKAVSRSLSKTGYFCFSTEHLPDELTDCPYTLHSCARFAHKQSYVKTLADDMGFQILNIEITTLRKNQGENVQGMLVVMKRKT